MKLGTLIQFDLQSNTLLIQGLTTLQLRQLSNLSSVTGLLSNNIAQDNDTCHVTMTLSQEKWERLVDAAHRLGYMESKPETCILCGSANNVLRKQALLKSVNASDTEFASVGRHLCVVCFHNAFNGEDTVLGQDWEKYLGFDIEHLRQNGGRYTVHTIAILCEECAMTAPVYVAVSEFGTPYFICRDCQHKLAKLRIHIEKVLVQDKEHC